MADTNKQTNQQQFFETLALHAGAQADPTTGTILTPIYQTTTYRQEAVGVDKGYTYSRAGNPTVTALEKRLAALEATEFATCYATGLAAATTKLIFIETPANPTLRLTDISLAATLARQSNALLVVDNTLLTPALQRPLDLGADVCLHSTTKFIEGHNATVGGALITRNRELHEQFDFIRNLSANLPARFKRRSTPG